MGFFMNLTIYLFIAMWHIVIRAIEGKLLSQGWGQFVPTLLGGTVVEKSKKF